MDTFRWEAHFEDTGCQLSPSCQECPLPRCKYEMTRAERSSLKGWVQRAKAVEVYRRLRDTDPGPSNRVIARLAAAEVGVTDRTIYRALARARIFDGAGSA